MTAKIGLEDVRIHAPHGFFEEEHLMGNEFSIDVEVEASIAGAARNDDLGGTVNYATIYYLIQAEMKKPTQLLEALAYRMGNRILNQFDNVSSVKLRLRKINPPLGGKVGAAVVEVSLGAGSGGGGGFGMPAPRQDTFEDPPGFSDDGYGGGGFSGGGFAGGGFSGGGLSGLPKKSTPAVVFDETPLADDGEAYDDGAREDDGFVDDGGPEFDLPDGGEEGDYEEGDYEEGDYDEGDYGDMEFDDNVGYDDYDMGDMGDIDPAAFNFDDLK